MIFPETDKTTDFQVSDSQWEDGRESIFSQRKFSLWVASRAKLDGKTLEQSFSNKFLTIKIELSTHFSLKDFNEM